MSNLFELAINEVSPQINKSRFLFDLNYKQEIINQVLNRAVKIRDRLDKCPAVEKALRNNKPISNQLKYKYRKGGKIK